MFPPRESGLFNSPINRLAGGLNNLDKAPDAFRTISEVAQDLGLPQHVLRFWETRFAQIKPMKRGGGRRYYRPDDVDLLRGIQYLLYGEGYTIRGVQRLLKENGGRFVQSVWQNGAPQPEPVFAGDRDDDDPPEVLFQAQPPARGLPLSPAREDEPARRDSSPAAKPAFPQPADRVFDNATVAPMNGPEIEPDHSTGLAAEQGSSEGEHGSHVTLSPETETARLSRDDVRKLQATLFELGECRRLLEAALKDEL